MKSTEEKITTIEIRRTSFINKGAEMMLLSSIESIRNQIENVIFAAEPREKNAEFGDRSKLHLYQKIGFIQKSFLCSVVVSVLPKAYRRNFGIVKSSEIDVVLDAAGFAYSDQWGYKNCLELALSSVIWRMNGTCVILLPQAFGPFNKKLTTKLVQFAMKGVTLVYARDRTSYENLKNIIGEGQKLRMSPDFTCLLDKQQPAVEEAPKNAACIILNKRMVDRVAAENVSAYFNFVEVVIAHLKRHEIPTFILVHEVEDEVFAHQIVDRMGSEIPVINESNPKALKWIINESKFVIGSRYHGLVSALSQGVPALGIGWSHKYERLFEDYNYSEGLVKVDLADDEIEKKISMLLSNSDSSEFRNELTANSMKIKKDTKKMWIEVVSAIRKHGGS